MIVSAYRDREINLGKAAELLSMYQLELRMGPADLAEAQAEVDAMRVWFADVS